MAAREQERIEREHAEALRIAEELRIEEALQKEEADRHQEYIQKLAMQLELMNKAVDIALEAMGHFDIRTPVQVNKDEGKMFAYLPL